MGNFSIQQRENTTKSIMIAMAIDRKKIQERRSVELVKKHPLKKCHSTFKLKLRFQSFQIRTDISRIYPL